MLLRPQTVAIQALAPSLGQSELSVVRLEQLCPDALG